LSNGALFTETRARKKKTLTEPIDILPFPEKSLRNTKNPPKEKKIPAPEVKNIISEKSSEKPVVKTKISIESKSGHLSIKQILQEEKDNQDKKNEELPREKVDIQKTTILWRQYAYRMKDKGMETFYNALIKRDPLFETSEEIKIIVENQIQIDYIRPLLGDLTLFLRKQLKNHFIEIKLDISDSPEEVKFLNGKDKFEALANKNPKLITLKNLFNLDIEF
jgi:DNA polymerase-3 subunit gamma/tau